MYITFTPRNVPERCLCECFFSFRELKIASGFDRAPEIDRGYHLYKKERDSQGNLDLLPRLEMDQ